MANPLAPEANQQNLGKPIMYNGAPAISGSGKQFYDGKAWQNVPQGMVWNQASNAWSKQ